MVKKVKKTRWRNLEVPLGSAAATTGEPANEDKGHHQRHAADAKRVSVRSSTSRASVLVMEHRGKWAKKIPVDENEEQMKKTHQSHVHRLESKSNDEAKVYDEDDEYTKITTPRQDVLFKKGYLTRRKNYSTASTQENMETEDRSQQLMNGDDGSYVYPSAPFVDPSRVLLVGGNSYEMYDPYTGNMTVVLEAPPTMLTATMPCKPVPLQPVQWFDPTPSNGAPLGEWCCPYSSDAAATKHYSPADATTQPNAEAPVTVDVQENQVNESTETNGQQQPAQTESEIRSTSANVPIYQQQYVYPGFVFGAPVYNIDGVNVQFCLPPNAHASTVIMNNEDANMKKRRKRKRRKRGEENDETNDTNSSEEPLSAAESSVVIEQIDNPSSNTLPLYNVVGAAAPVYDPKFLLPFPTYPPFFGGPDVPYFQPTPPPVIHENGATGYYEHASSVATAELQEQHQSRPDVISEEYEEEELLTTEDVCSTSSAASDSKAAASSKTVTLNVHCKPFYNNNKSGDKNNDDDENLNSEKSSSSSSSSSKFENNVEKNELCEVGSNSSSNSDSGISSPNSDSYVKEEDLCDRQSSSERFRDLNKRQNVATNGDGKGKPNKKSQTRKTSSSKPGKNKKQQHGVSDAFVITSLVDEFKKSTGSSHVTAHQQKGKKVQFDTNVRTNDTNKTPSPTIVSSDRKRRTKKTTSLNGISADNGKKKSDKKTPAKQQDSSDDNRANVKNTSDNYTDTLNTSEERKKSLERNCASDEDLVVNSFGEEVDGDSLGDDRHRIGAHQTATSTESQNEADYGTKQQRNERDNENDAIAADTAAIVVDSETDDNNDAAYKENSEKHHVHYGDHCETIGKVHATLLSSDDNADVVEEIGNDDCTLTETELAQVSQQPIAPPRRRKSSQKLALEQSASQIVNDIITEAEKRAALAISEEKYSESARQSLPITEAVTKWLKENGGLPQVSETGSDFSDENLPDIGEFPLEEDNSTEPVNSGTDRHRVASCVIC